MSITFKSADKILIPYLKALYYGDTGTGKTTFAVKTMIGLMQHLKITDRVLYFFDTERSAKAVYTEFVKPAGVKMEVAESRSLSDVKEFIAVAEKAGSPAIIDSTSHIWQFTMKNYLAKKNEARQKKANANGWNFTPQKRLYMNDWLEIKPAWVEYFDDPYLQSDIHIIQCTRSKNVFDEVLEDDTNKNSKTITLAGTAPRTESNSAYEPYIMVEMIKDLNPKFEEDPKKNRKFLRFGVVVKDKLHELDSRVLENPGFDSILPHINRLDTGKQQSNGKADLSGSDKLFEDKSGDFEAIQRKKKAALENIKDGLVRVFPGTGENEKKKKTTVLKALSGESSWTKWESYPLSRLEFYSLCVQQLENLYGSFVDIEQVDEQDRTAAQKKVVKFFKFKNIAELESNIKTLAGELET